MEIYVIGTLSHNSRKIFACTQLTQYSNTSKLAIFGALKKANSRIWMLVKGTASLEVKSSERNRELENFASLEPRVCEVLLYLDIKSTLSALLKTQS